VIDIERYIIIQDIEIYKKGEIFHSLFHIIIRSGLVVVVVIGLFGTFSFSLSS
jgi:hypothetical protein